MSEKEFMDVCEPDNIADEADGFVAYHPTAENEVHYDYRAIIQYCRERGIEPLDMTILNIHGYQGSAQNAAYGALQANGCDAIISPAIDYDAASPERIVSMLRGIIDEQHVGLIVGTSLGGFFAAVLSAETHLPVMLVNPCLLPFLHLPRLGFQGDIRPFISLFGTLTQLDRDNVSCIVGDADEIISTHDFTEKLLANGRFRRIPGGHHSGATLPLPEYFGEMLHYYTDTLPRKELGECVPGNLFDRED